MFNQDGICTSCSLRFWKYFTCPQLSEEKRIFTSKVLSLCAVCGYSLLTDQFIHSSQSKEPHWRVFVRSYAYWHKFYHSIWGYVLWHIGTLVLSVKIKLELLKHIPSHTGLEMHCTSQELSWIRKWKDCSCFGIMLVSVTFFFFFWVKPQWKYMLRRMIPSHTRNTLLFSCGCFWWRDKRIHFLKPGEPSFYSLKYRLYTYAGSRNLSLS